MEPQDRSAAVVEEQRRLRQLRAIVDLTTNVLAQGRLGRAEAEELVAATRRRVLDLFPDKEATFDLILAPRFAPADPRVRGRWARSGEGAPFPAARRGLRRSGRSTTA